SAPSRAGFLGRPSVPALPRRSGYLLGGGRGGGSAGARGRGFVTAPPSAGVSGRPVGLTGATREGLVHVLRRLIPAPRLLFQAPPDDGSQVGRYVRSPLVEQRRGLVQVGQ